MQIAYRHCRDVTYGQCLKACSLQCVTCLKELDFKGRVLLVNDATERVYVTMAA